MNPTDLAKDWLKRAKSNLTRIKLGKTNADILYEDLCYDAQQTVEKALKSIYVLKDIVFPRTHNI